MRLRLIELLGSHEAGDLVAATQLVEAAVACDEGAGDDPALQTVAREIAARYRAAARMDAPEPTEAERGAWIAALRDEETDREPATAAAMDPSGTGSAHEVAIDDLDVVTSFIHESVDHLDDIEDRVLTLENEYREDLVNSIFRSIHTIKGVASFVGFSYVSAVSHELETLLDDVRNGTREIDEDLITVLLDGTDVLGRIVHSIERQVAASGTQAPDRVTEESFDHERIVLRVRMLRENPPAFRARELATSTGDAAPGSRGTEETGCVDSPEAASGETRGSEPASAGHDLVTREMVEAFLEESTDLLDVVEQELLSAETSPIAPDAVGLIFRSIHTVKGNAGFFWFARVEQQCSAMEEELERFRSGEASIDHEAAGRFLDMLDAVRRSVQAVAAAAGGGRDGDDSDRSDPDEPSEGDAIGEILLQMGEVSRETIDRALARQQRKLGEILVGDEHVEPGLVEKALAEQAKRRETAGVQSEYTVTRKDIRVDTTKLDKLFDLVGELITAESMILGEVAQHDGDSSVGKAASYLQKITREMQEITLSMRMIPLEATFGKMRRLVRDLARRFEKDVQIEISGEQTEMDKNVIEEVSDPLVHIIRNAIDHGIESASERAAAGKPRCGTIRLSAKHEGNEIWITVADDGRGLDRDRILAKAVERGLATEHDVDLSDDQIFRFIFEPAFSTADSVSEISGRGVGMDVVRQNVEKLRGRVDLRSTPGSGTTFIMRIPLTLAILDGVTFEIGSTCYSVPTTELVTFQGYSRDTVTGTGSGHHAFRLRDELIPIVQYEHREGMPDHGVIIVLQSGGRRAALLVDRIIGYRQFVVRAMPTYLINMRAVSGCSIQGDGSISFIIDVAQLIAEELEHVRSA